MIKTSPVYSAILLLDDGNIFYGKAFGKKGTTTGEICFNTGMTGYQEVFTDPSYYGQVVIMNTVHVGNYGVNQNDVESDSVKVKGVIGRNLESQFSRFQADDSLQNYFEKQDIVAIDGIDTRMLVSHIRTQGAMNCIISTEEFNVDKLKQQLQSVPDMSGLELASIVSTKENYTLGNENSDIRVAVLDYGVKNAETAMIELVDYNEVYGKGIETADKTQVKRTRRAGSRKKNTDTATATTAKVDARVTTASAENAVDTVESNSPNVASDDVSGIETPEEDATK